MSVTRRTFLGFSAAMLVPACGESDRGAITQPTADAGPPVGPGGARDGAAPDATWSEPPPPYTGPGPEPSQPWSAPGAEDATAFASGIQTGDAAPSSVIVSLRTKEPAIDLAIMRGSSSGWEPAGARTDLTPDREVVKLELDNLRPDTTYAIAAFSKDGARRSRIARFRTAIPEGQKRIVRFGATSCLGGAGAPFVNMSKCAAAGPLDFFCLLGDTVYADGQDDFEGVWRAALSQAGVVDMTAATSVIGIWDDHEIEDNWSWSTPGMLARHDAALATFNRSIPHRDGPNGAHLYRSLSWGAALDVFVLDCRDERHNSEYISKLQMEWLKSALSASKARFKIILNSVPIIDFSKTVIGSVEASDRWQGYQQRAEILEYIKVEAIHGVLWLSGDFHFGLVSHVDPPGGLAEDQWEVLCGPAGSKINVIASGLSTSAQVTDIVKEFNSVLFEADPDAGTVKLRFVSDAGATLVEKTLSL